MVFLAAGSCSSVSAVVRWFAQCGIRHTRRDAEQPYEQYPGCPSADALAINEHWVTFD
jgi:hypothetical protein